MPVFKVTWEKQSHWQDIQQGNFYTEYGVELKNSNLVYSWDVQRADSLS